MNPMIKKPKSAKSNMKQLDTTKATFHKNQELEEQITHTKSTYILPFLGQNSHLDKLCKWTS